MRAKRGTLFAVTVFSSAAVLALSACPAWAQLNLGPAQQVQAAGSTIAVPGYSVPSFADWNSDGLNDLIVGEGGGGHEQKARVYVNVGTASAPAFDGWFYVQADGADMTYAGTGCGSCLEGVCLGLFPRLAYWNGDDLPDMVVGQPCGAVALYLNVGTLGSPVFGAAELLQYGPAGSKVDMMPGARATPTVVDYNSDGRKDLVAGGYPGYVTVYLNEGTDTEPDFIDDTFAQGPGGALNVPTLRTSPHVFDADGDGMKDLLVGDTNGQLLLYTNVGTDAAPILAGPAAVCSEGVPIDLAGTPRSRPFVCDWTGDGLPDVLVGAGDGIVHLYQGVPAPAAMGLFAVAVPWALLRRRRR